MDNRLQNIIGKDEALKLLGKENTPRRTFSFYRYVRINDPKTFRDELFCEWQKLGILGRIYLAEEGINAQLNVPEQNFDNFVKALDEIEELKDMPLKLGIEEGQSFWKLTIKIKKQIVADGLRSGTYDVSDVGNHLTPEEFNKAMDNDDTVVVDMRNHYESRIGRFDDAICPDADTFREELKMIDDLLKDKKDKKVLLYCTGGIRCEKASSYLKHLGFKDVNQLYGGIINYAHAAREKDFVSKFKGKNFVFDDRLGERITEDVLSECDQCSNSCDDFTNCENEVCNLLFVQCGLCKKKFNGCCSNKCEQIAALPREERREYRRKLGSTNQELFKSRQRPNLKYL
jgi:UPF0176 protein